MMVLPLLDGLLELWRALRSNPLLLLVRLECAKVLHAPYVGYLGRIENEIEPVRRSTICIASSSSVRMFQTVLAGDSNRLTAVH